jgi:hypothetical protein
MINKKSIILLVLLLCAVAAATGYKYTQFIDSDPAYCTLCHLTQEGYNSLEQSKHYNIICQDCHELTVLEGNNLLMSYYVMGNKEVDQAHGRKAPWKECIECHDREASQGSITFRDSYGHARHVFMHNFKCNLCHEGKLHNFEIVESNKCKACHSDKLVHGMGTTGTQCLNCHSFSDRSEYMVTDDKCYACHLDLLEFTVMININCHECHHPHEKEKLKNPDCLGSCHSTEASVGQHGVHMEQTDLTCIECHKPHLWEVSKENAPGLCDQCHTMRDPKTFLY